MWCRANRGSWCSRCDHVKSPPSSPRASPQHAQITTSLYLNAVAEALQETAYDAGLAGFSYSISGQTALELTLSGYSDKFNQWAGTVAAALVQPAVDADTFATWQHMLVQALENANDDQP